MKFLCMLQIMNVTNYEGIQRQFTWNGKTYDGNKFMDDLDALVEEFLEPYVIDSTSKED